MVAKAQATKSASKLPEEERDAIFKKLMESIENGVFDSQYITHKAAGKFLYLIFSDLSTYMWLLIGTVFNNHIANLHGMKSSQQGK